MTRKSMGYVELIWRCPRCEPVNPGPQKFCNGCGAPQPQDVQFEQPPQEKLLDEATAAAAKAGPDIHCPYCDARNPGTAKFCGACGGDLSQGKRREAGKLLGAFRAEPAAPVACPACGASNPAGAARCATCGAALPGTKTETPKPPLPARPSRFPVVLLALGAVVACGVLAAVLLRAGRRTELVGRVEQVSWTRSLPILALTSVEHEDWLDQIPAEAEIVSCSVEYRYTSEEPVAGAVEVCGTPYTVDTGSGLGEVVQDCVYEVYQDYCTYTVLEMAVTDTLTASGSDLQPYWPQASLMAGQQFGEGTETYRVVFITERGSYSYSPSEEAEFVHFAPGSEWNLEVDGLGRVVAVERVE